MVGGANNEIREADDGDSKAALEKGFAGLSEMLLSVMADPGRRVRISLDGAGLDKLAERLAKLRLFHRPLFTGADRSMVEAGPWLVNPYRAAPPAEGNGDEAQPLDKAGLSAAAARLEALLAEIGPSPFAVFWVGGPAFGDAELYRHLRTLNKVLVPIESAVRSDVDAAVDATHEAVLFRHADGNVLAQVLPVLDEAQTSAVLRSFDRRGVSFAGLSRPAGLAGPPLSSAAVHRHAAPRSPDPVCRPDRGHRGDAADPDEAAADTVPAQSDRQ